MGANFQINFVTVVLIDAILELVLLFTEGNSYFKKIQKMIKIIHYFNKSNIVVSTIIVNQM